jgi:hypothetical protein
MKRTSILALLILFSTAAMGADPQGTLVFEVQDYESEVKLKKNIVRQLEHGGLVWGFLENELVIPLVAQRFVKPEMNNTTRWGETDEITLPPGDYTLTCIGYQQKELSRNVDKVLSESAYFNLDRLTFTIRDGDTTRIQVLPRFAKSGKLVKVFIPALHVSVFEGDEKTAEAVISERTDSSIAWDDYEGPLKH